MAQKKSMVKVFLVILVLMGLILRIAGLPFYGNHNFDTYKQWGYGTRVNGLADTFAGGYGPIAYLIMGMADYIGSFTPQIWWWPYKGANLVFEILILFFLFRRFPKNQLRLTFLYWLNPWFLVPGAWQGFWDGAFGFFILWTVFIFDAPRRNIRDKFLFGGFVFSLAALTKPQIIAPVSILLLIFFFKYFLKIKFKEIYYFATGAVALPILFNLYFILHMKGMLYLLKAYSGFIFYMPFLVASEINIWHTVTRIIMHVNNMTGPIYSLSTLEFPYNIFERVAHIAYFILLLLFVLRTDKAKEKNYYLKAFAFAFILMPQILTRSHAYHFYPATLLLIPLIILTRDKFLFLSWVSSVYAHFYNIWWQYGLGDSIGHVFRPMGEPVLSIMGIIAFISTLGLIKVFLSRKLA